MKEGDRVIDEDTGDIGVVVREKHFGSQEEDGAQQDYQGKAWWVHWETGDFAGEELWAFADMLKLEGAPHVRCAEQALDALRPLLEAPTKVQELHLVIKNCGDGSSTIQYVLDETVLARMEELADEGDEEYASGDGLQVKTLCFPPDFDMEHFIASNKISVITLERLQ